MTSGLSEHQCYVIWGTWLLLDFYFFENVLLLAQYANYISITVTSIQHHIMNGINELNNYKFVILKNISALLCCSLLTNRKGCI